MLILEFIRQINMFMRVNKNFSKIYLVFYCICKYKSNHIDIGFFLDCLYYLFIRKLN